LTPIPSVHWTRRDPWGRVREDRDSVGRGRSPSHVGAPQSTLRLRLDARATENAGTVIEARATAGGRAGHDSWQAACSRIRVVTRMPGWPWHSSTHCSHSECGGPGLERSAEQLWARLGSLNKSKAGTGTVFLNLLKESRILRKLNFLKWEIVALFEMAVTELQTPQAWHWTLFLERTWARESTDKMDAGRPLRNTQNLKQPSSA
jgi:hypothetical protein